MKSLKFILASLIILVSMISCDTYYDGYSHRNNDYYYNGQQYKKLPPGQAKKMYGGSAKDYAPGQQKKYYR
ncbi:hypothetical protein [Elizabethkingia meningoseptica]|uniref:hypothetical protein n=1 Tax=Elizabethkingia meningoseptica TaxID=238 RepID=UPI003891258B